MPTPDLFTLTEAAIVLRIGRTTAYELARRDLVTGGGVGLDVRRIGGQLRVPRAALERLIGGPVSWPAGRGVGSADGAVDAPIETAPRLAPVDATSTGSSPTTASPSTTTAPTLPFDS